MISQIFADYQLITRHYVTKIGRIHVMIVLDIDILR